MTYYVWQVVIRKFMCLNDDGRPIPLLLLDGLMAVCQENTALAAAVRARLHHILNGGQKED